MKFKFEMKKQLIKLNSLVRKKYNFGFADNYPFRSSTEFVKKLMGRKSIICAEIGVWEGDNALNTLQKLPNIKKIYLVDPWKEYPSYEEEGSMLTNPISGLHKNKDFGFNEALNKTKKRLKKYRKKIRIIRKYSNDAIGNLPNEMDFIYIDGNHDYEFVKRDIELYYKKLKRGGVLAGHDIQSFSGVTKAFCEFVVKNKLDPIIKRMDWIVVKK